MKSILVLAGASGAGKTSVATRHLSENSEYKLIRSATTRQRRGDGHDDEYLYFSEEEFKALISRGELLEYMKYGDNFYGTPHSEIELAFAEGKIPLLILDLEGIKSLRRKSFDFSVFAFYIYEDINEIEKRLYAREFEHGASIEAFESFLKRKEANIRDYLLLPSLADKFDAFIKNTELPIAVDSVLTRHRALSLGEVKNAEENAKIAEELALSAKPKI